MKYIKVNWKHDFQNEPIILYSELDKEMNEIRKVEVYRNNVLGFAYKNISVNGTFLSKTKIIELSEINKDAQFLASEIKKEEFELIWRKAIKEQ